MVSDRPTIISPRRNYVRIVLPVHVSMGPLHKLYGEALPESVFAHVKVVAGNVPTLRSEFREFTQANVIAKFKVPMVTRTVEDSKRHFLNWRRLQLGRGKAIEPTPTRIPESSKLRNYIAKRRATPNRSTFAGPMAGTSNSLPDSTPWALTRGG